MAITKEHYFSDTYTIGKGSKKKDLIVIGQTDDIPSADTSTLGVFLSEKYDTGASTDDPFGIRLVSMEFNIGDNSVFSAVRYVNATMSVTSRMVGTTTSGGRNLGQKETLFAFGTPADTAMRNTIADNGYYRQEYREDYTRMIVLSEMYLNFSFFSPTNDFKVSRRWTFEKVKLTKNEYLEKIVRNL